MTVTEIITAKFRGKQLNAQTVELAIAEVEQSIKNYCNIEKVPEALNFVWANMAVDYIRYQEAICETKNSNTAPTFSAAEISSLKIGDTNIQLGEGSSANQKGIALKSHVPNLDEIVLNYREQLNKFRRMVW